MSGVILKSDFDSFEENVFYVSQAQRSLYLVGEYDCDCNAEWLSEYFEDLYFDCFNREFKSFYIETVDGYELFSDEGRNKLLIMVINKTIEKVSSLTESGLESFLSKKVGFDYENSDVFDVDEFIKDEIFDLEVKRPALRVLFVLYNVSRLLQKEVPFTYENFEKYWLMVNGDMNSF
jgi:hypothetical protein